MGTVTEGTSKTGDHQVASIGAMASPAGDLDRLTLYRYAIEIVLDRELRIQAPGRGVLLRGAFGEHFRALVCHDLSASCPACAIGEDCPFPAFFSPTQPAGVPAIRRMKDVPRPFVFSDPMPEASQLLSGKALSIGLVLAGRAVAKLPYLVVALRSLGERGMGREGARFNVRAVRALDGAGLPAGCVYEEGREFLGDVRVPLGARDLARPGDDRATRIRVRFLTPTDLRDAPPPSFGLLVRRARQRAGALATFFGSGELEADPRAAATLADTVTLSSADVERIDWRRTSRRTGRSHSVAGFTGAVLYEGSAVASLIPLLRLAELIHVGRHASFGSGQVQVEALP